MTHIEVDQSYERITLRIGNAVEKTLTAEEARALAKRLKWQAKMAENYGGP